MTIEEFKLLQPKEQRKAIKTALAMGARTEGNTEVKFYKIDSFYIEAYFHPRYKIFTKCVTFTEKEFIKRYLNKD